MEEESAEWFFGAAGSESISQTCSAFRETVTAEALRGKRMKRLF